MLAEVNALGFDLDESMVIKFGESYFRGADALFIMSLLGTRSGWFNRITAMLFRYKAVARLLYPLMRATRNMLIRLNGVPKLRNLQNRGSRDTP